MNVVDTIHQKVVHLPPKAQEEVLEIVEQIEERYHSGSETNGMNAEPHVLDLLAKIQIDGPPDLAERHDFYANRKLED